MGHPSLERGKRAKHSDPALTVTWSRCFAVWPRREPEVRGKEHLLFWSCAKDVQSFGKRKFNSSVSWGLRGSPPLSLCEWPGLLLNPDQPIIFEEKMPCEALELPCCFAMKESYGLSPSGCPRGKSAWSKWLPSSTSVQDELFPHPNCAGFRASAKTGACAEVRSGQIFPWRRR